ncbi:hypothetical protein BLS_007672 [Venturia inaequalis]|uniref:3-oxo-5-alpha-steroid 4-dehydrogenase C-terminal domain-containing protein n=1 Tax=Venturia inaequalis TaxID=5025 RepID=A0A8H3U7L7_VENIN|nr:hypothetical protein BLS_007672 [Venturia inaequalis]
MLTSAYQFVLAVTDLFMQFTALQWLTTWYPMGKTSIESRFNIPGRIGWMTMEAPGFILLLYIMSTLPEQTGMDSVPISNWAMAGMFTIHYLYRAILYPLVQPSMSPIHIFVWFAAFTFQITNATVIGGWLAGYGPRTVYDWSGGLYRMEIGMVIWAWGLLANAFHDDDLREIRRASLRKQTKAAEEKAKAQGTTVERVSVDKVYMIPKNGLFHYVLFAHYFYTLSPAHERTRLLSEDRSEIENPTSQSRDRASIHGSLRLPGLRYRASARDFRSPSMGQPHGPSRARRISVSIAPPPVRDDDHESQNFSLAGPQVADAMAANTSYVDPGYTQLNPEYEQPSNIRPVWGLAKPLPRVLRPGMVPTVSELHKEVLHQKQKQHRNDLERQEEELEPDKIEATLRYDKIVPALKDVREEREIQLCETFGKISPFPSPSIRGNASMNAGFFSHDQSYAIPEETEDLLGDQLSQLSSAIKDVRDSKVDNPPYEDAIPLQAYEADENEIHNLHTYWSVIRLRFREPLAELLAITVQLTLGFSANLAITVSRGRAGVGDTADWAWGLATMVAIYIAGGISGAHLNPAMSLMLWIYRGFPFEKVPIYVMAQMLGAFLAALIAFGIYQPGIVALGEPATAFGGTAGNFITFPKETWVNGSTAFFTEFASTTILAITVLALGDDSNAPPGAGMNAFIIGLVIVILSISFGWNTGLAMNPARDFGPRVALHLLGYRNDTRGNSLFADGYWFFVAWLGPISGALLGGFLYDAAIFTGGESPVNYPTKRMKRATRKWKKRWQARFRRTTKKIK